MQVLHRITLPEHPLFLPDISPVRDAPEPLTAAVNILHGPAVTLSHALHSGMLPHRQQLQPPPSPASPHSPAHARIVATSSSRHTG